ncbi:MAG TPA: response regulator [Anaeromyxobacteraceae bacterium]|nr:response regulator [Anaeromyxobacteraceae bacterium]
MHERLLRPHVVVGEPSPGERARLVALLRDAGDLHVAGEAGTADELLEVLRRTQPDGLLVDEAMALQGVPELLRRIRREAPRLVIVALSRAGGRAWTSRADALGADLVVDRRHGLAELVEALSLRPAPRPLAPRA